MVCRFSDLRDKEVVNICDGKMLGYVCDLEIDLNTGHLCSIIVPGESRGFGFSRGGEIIIPWDKIERIGEDAILVALPDVSVCCRDHTVREKKRKGGFFQF